MKFESAAFQGQNMQRCATDGDAMPMPCIFCRAFIEGRRNGCRTGQNGQHARGNSGADGFVSGRRSNIARLRDQAGDSHGKVMRHVTPQIRHTCMRHVPQIAAGRFTAHIRELLGVQPAVLR